MTEPLLQADVQSDDATLWNKAPAWRTLTVTASLLTLAAVAAPLLLQQPDAPAKAVIAASAGKILLPQTPPVQTAPPAQIALAPAPPAATTTPVSPATIHHHAAVSQPAQTGAVCHLNMPATTPQLLGIGTVASFEDRALSMARIRLTEQASGGLIDPAFIDNPRVVVKSPTGQLRTFILPKGMSVQIGDRVMVQNGYRNAALPCNYVPNEIASDLGPAPQQTAPVPANPGQTAPITDILTTPQ